MVFRLQQEHLMKKIVSAIALLSALNATTSHAESEAQIENCRSISQVAEVIMTARQQDMPLPEVMRLVVDVEAETETDENVKNVVKELVKTAYKAPIGPTEESQKQYIAEFRNQIFLNCYE
ncbi:hypothetical protein A3758_29645 [Oleiphilus sp. HI0118]|nr:hypothetical protein A3750_08150 [Oleiphilus sp. HI0079]KZZ50507.1 hypothetical protein A3758_12430 [Oleiphilus sp. HI0118]KZZ51123.1 hypothetical protein A3758_29645 [Oleiphilus sp. HI0118]